MEGVESVMEEVESAMEEEESAMEGGKSAMEGGQAHHSIPSGSTNLWYNTKSLRALHLGYDNNCDLQDLYLDSLLPF